MLLPLMTKTWRDHWRGLLAWTTGLVLITAIELYVYPGIRDSAASVSALVENYPDAMKQIFKMDDYTSGTGFLNIELFSMLVPLIFISVGASWGASATAEEEERGTADLLLTLPVTRTRILLTKMVAAVAALLALAVALVIVLAIGTQIVDMEISIANMAAACFMSFLLGVLYSGVGFLVGVLTGHRGIALGAAIALGLAGFLFYSLSPMVEGFEKTNPVNPFQWALGNNALVNGVDMGYALRLLLVALILFVASELAFRRRDISAR